MVEFKAWPKIPRVGNTEYTFTEKIDGTNACVIITGDGGVYAQSRTRIITPESDNFGFARWVEDNKEGLRALGEGYHYGEWWGAGIQRIYGQKEKHFSIFNPYKAIIIPDIIKVVPHLKVDNLEEAINLLKAGGSIAAPGFMDVEGVIMYCHYTRHYWKYIINKNDDRDKL